MTMSESNRFLFAVVAVLVLLGTPMSVYAGDKGLAFPTKEEEITAVFKSEPIRTRGIRGVADVVEDRKVGAMIHFDLNSAAIRPESYKLLDEFGKAFSKGLKDEDFVVVGHTDSSGSDEYNYRLSINRAQAVANYLAGHHQLDASRFSIKGYGEQQPIADNDSAAGRAQNRRVEFVLR